MLLRDYPESRIVGHRDLSPDLNHNGEIEPEEWIKECPCFDAATILQETPVNPGYLYKKCYQVNKVCVSLLLL